MRSVSRLARLYETIFREEPSSQTTASLLAMEEILGLTQDDLLARMMVVQLRVADQIDASLKQRSADEATFIRETKALLPELKSVIQEAGNVRLRARRIPLFRRMGLGTDDEYVKVETFRRALPMLRYLSQAFMSRGASRDRRESIGAARFDLFLLTVTGVVLFAIGAAIDKYMRG